MKVDGQATAMLLPSAHRAVVDVWKLRDYCLSADHDYGKHKARLFAAALGIRASEPVRQMP